ncbi:MAG: diguanylate cyclase [Anaerolineaceae bacterium]|nr:diguanylate cyclase [Anaerolineaceae bacterium]MBN2677316.1 diguanylate cyclase [Anaerolineaceae bacterium]
MLLLILRPDVIPLWIGIGISTYLLAVGYKYRYTNLGLDFFVLMSLACIWQLSYAINIITSALWLVKILVTIEVSCMAAISVLILVFAGRLTNRNFIVQPGVIIALSILPMITFFLLLSNDAHHMVYTGFNQLALSSGYLISPSFGSWYTVIGLYSYLLIIVAFVLLVDWYQKATPASRGQAVVLILGILPPVIANVLHASGYINTTIDPTPLAFSISGIVLLWGLYRFGLLDMIPIAREIVFESITDGVIVLDNQERVMDINPAAARLFGGNNNSLIGKKMRELIHKLDTCLLIVKDEEGEYDTMRFSEGNETVDYEIRASQLTDRSGILEGKVILLNNITERRKLEDELRVLSSLDHLTGLVNRRTFFLELEKQIRLARRYKYMLTVCMLDLDRFKALNDQYGHQVGDDALALASMSIQNSIRMSDIAARYGGDELALLLTHTGEKGALTLCNRIAAAVTKVNVQSDIQLGVSIGIATLKKEDIDTGETLIARADRALYQAKNEGRGGMVVG